MTIAVVTLLLFVAAPASPPARRVLDDAGHTIVLPKPASRVISTAPSVTELIYEAGGGARLVGTVDYSDYPPAAQALPRIGNNQKLDLERIARLKPDLALVWFHGNASREIDLLASLDIPIFFVEPHRIADIPGTLERIGVLLGSEPVAHAAADRFRARQALLLEHVAGRRPLDVFYQLADQPLLTINDRHIIADAIRLCGGRNVFGAQPMLVPHLSTESVVAANPDVIIATTMGRVDEASSAARTPSDPSFAAWMPFPRMKAVKTGQLWLIPAALISRQGPRILDGAEALCSALDAARKL